MSSELIPRSPEEQEKALAWVKSLKSEQSGDSRQLPTMADALAAGDGTLHGAIDYWQARALSAEKANQLPLAELSDEEIDDIGSSVEWNLYDIVSKSALRRFSRALIAADRKLCAQAEDLIDVQMERDYLRSVVDGSWGNADLVIDHMRKRRTQKKDKK